ncbi:MAG: dihydroorotase [Microscillaceae bacterium]|nr:dihydroorotase [Microscillaceae bacterium]MDW8461060.1 dihydroorotase [Cytophagales bacterium]
MLSYLISQATIFDKQSPYHLQKMDIWIENGTIKAIANSIPNLPANTKIIQGKELGVSIGWIDMRANFKEPGFEHQETLQTGRKVAMYGGFTDVVLLPNTQPVIQTKNDLAFILHTNRNNLVQLHPIAALTFNTQGKEMTEWLDLHTHGAIAFSDGEIPLNNSDILLKALQYLQQFDGLLINRAEDKMLTQHAQMHEGIVSTRLGLKGMPAFAEEIMVRQHLDFLRFAGGKLHLSLISTKKAVSLIRQAKAEGLKVTCDVAIHNLIFEDKTVENFDTNFKVNPPFRTAEHIEALWQGLADGTIDAIVSDHNPQDTEAKCLEFDLAAFGVIGLQTLFPALITYNKQVDISVLLEKITYQPRKILNLPIPVINLNQNACIIVFDLNHPWKFDLQNNVSLSQNSPFLGHYFLAKPLAVFNNQKVFEIE